MILSEISSPTCREKKFQQQNHCPAPNLFQKKNIHKFITLNRKLIKQKRFIRFFASLSFSGNSTQTFYSKLKIIFKARQYYSNYTKKKINKLGAGYSKL